MSYLHGFLFAPLALLSPNTALPAFLFWSGVRGLPVVARQPSIVPQDSLKILSLFLGWACLSCVWSLSPYNSLIASIKLIGFIFLGLSWVSFCYQQTQADIFSFLKGLALGCSGVVLFILMDYALGGAFVRLRGVSSIKVYYAASHVLALCFYPLCFWIYKNRSPLLCFLFAFFTVAAISLLDVDIALAALVLGGFVQGFAWLFSRHVFKFLWQTGFCLLMIVFPFFCAFILSPNLIQAFNHTLPVFSYVHRLHIWHFLSEKIFLHPWVGHGLDTSCLPSIRPTSYTWTFFEKTTLNPHSVHHILPQEPLFLHVHNAVIQLWFELGFIGICLASLFLLKVFARAHTWPHPPRILTFGYAATAITIALASLDFWHSWWFAALWISTGIVILVNRALAQQAKE